MKTQICPYLGSIDDPKTALNFPSDSNCCYHARPISTINTAHQASYCLNGQFAECPVYSMRQMKPLPPGIAAGAPRGNRVVRVLVFAFIPLALALMALLGSWIDRRIGGAQGLPSDTPGFLLSETPILGIFGTEASHATNTPYLPPSSTPENFETPTPMMAGNCVVPSGWEPYIIRPGDSLFRLSVTYNTSIQTIQAINCMGNSFTLTAGSILYVPILPTATPTVTQTPTRRPPVPPTATQSSGGGGSNPPPPPPPPPTATQAPPPTSAPPTSAPPTAVVPTEVPPTAAPLDTPTPEPTVVDPTLVP